MDNGKYRDAITLNAANPLVVPTLVGNCLRENTH